jgi:[protein-PII] uridylyltransferase
VRSFLETRARFIAEAEPGTGSARRLAAMTDEAVADLAAEASSAFSGRWAVVALGGWGAGALLPKSDLDLLVLADAPAERLKPFVEALLYPLWDGGLKVGHQVRSPKQQLKAMREDLKTRTAALTGRPLAGDTAWASETLATCAADTGKRRKSGLIELRQRPRTGSAYQLDPDLKDGVGGRRDYDELVWTSATLAGAVRTDPSELVAATLLTTHELEDLMGAVDTTATARWRLQRDGFGDVLSADAAPDFREDAETVQAALATTALMLERVRARLTPRRPWHSGLDVPAAVLEDEPFTPAQVFSALEQGEDGLPALELAAQSGRLDALIPGMRSLMAIRRPGLGHQLTVGAHCLRTAALVSSLRSDPTLARSLDETRDLRVVRVASLVHDVAKAETGTDHAERGAGPAHVAALRFGLTDTEASDASELVRLHLVLAETAHRADLDDEDAILHCAARIGRRTLVAPLHLLSAADALATGPATWSPWTATLVATLVSRVDAALTDSVDGAGIASRGEAVRADTLTTLAPGAERERVFVSRAPLRYLASRTPADVARDARLVAELSSAGGIDRARIAVSSGPAPGTHALTVAATDRPHLLSRLAGAMALAGLSILSVDAHGATQGVALDTFVVESATSRPVGSETFAKLDRLVEAALKDRLELATRLEERRKHYPARAAVAPRVEIAPSGWDTTVRVTAADRPGLLHDLSNAVAATGLDIRWAKILTADGVAKDTFHVVGPDGGPVDDQGVLGHLAMRLREVL